MVPERIIHKTIDLSRYKSWYPSSIPYYTTWGELRVPGECELPNYGGYPCNIRIPDEITANISMQTDVNILLTNPSFPEEEIGETGDVTISQFIRENMSYFNENEPIFVNEHSYLQGFPSGKNVVMITGSNPDMRITDGTVNECRFIEPGEARPKYASFQTLVIWYRFFKHYYSVINTETCSGSSYTYNEDDGIEYTLNITPDVMDTFNRLGGNQTYVWLRTILENLYEVPTDGGIDFTYFPQFLTWWDIKRHLNVIQSAQAEAENYEDPKKCCILQKMYEKYGGKENMDIILKWLRDKSYSGTSFTKEDLTIPSVNIDICLTNNVSNVGSMSELAEEWTPGEDYMSGSLVTYEGDLYKRNEISKPLSGSYFYDTDQRVIEFYSEGYDMYSASVPSDGEHETSIRSGQTESKLTEFTDKKMLYDNLGNRMEGSYSEAITGDGITIDIPYHQYNTSQLQKTDVPYILNSSDPNLGPAAMKMYEVVGNILSSITAYYKDGSGNRIDETELKWNNEEENIKKLNEMYQNAPKEEETDDNVYLEFTYINGATMRVVEDTEGGVVNGFHYAVTDSANCVWYKDEQMLIMEKATYYTSTNSSFWIYRYKLQPSRTVTVKNSVTNSLIVYGICDFYYEYVESTEKDECGNVMEPFASRGYELGISGPPSIDSDVYVQRGLSSAFEKYISLGSIQTFEALENYQNHAFNIISSSGE